MKNLINDLKLRKKSIAVIGMGYVGMPIAVEFAKRGIQVIGFDLNKEKIKEYISGKDPTQEVGDDMIAASTVQFTSAEEDLENASFFIVAVPTPVYDDHTPNLAPVESAAHVIGKHIPKEAIVVFESTVYPGVTENVCVPIIEKESGLKCGIDFKVGYSPERINPGDKLHRLSNICKIVSGMDEESASLIQEVYDLIIDAGTYLVSNIKTAEAIKVVENSQRDINIAFMNELAMVFDKMGIDTNEVVDGMNTKWNALGFRPGLVGGHCIGVDPYYFVYEAERLGYHSQIILSGRRVNDAMGEFVADATIRQLILAGFAPQKAKVVILGLTFKENCPDIRNSKVLDIIKRLKEYGIQPILSDPYANEEEVYREYGFQLTDLDNINCADGVILAVAHESYKNMNWAQLMSIYNSNLKLEERVMIDVKGIRKDKELSQIKYWRL